MGLLEFAGGERRLATMKKWSPRADRCDCNWLLCDANRNDRNQLDDSEFWVKKNDELPKIEVRMAPVQE